MRLVVDTNLMIRALLSEGRAVRRASPEAITELVERIERYGQRGDADLNSQLDCRDPKDNYVLSLALASKAEIILTEDDDLLVLDPWRGIRVMRLFQFLQDHPLPAQ